MRNEMSFIERDAFMTGRLTSTAGYCSTLGEEIEKTFDRKKIMPGAGAIFKWRERPGTRCDVSVDTNYAFLSPVFTLFADASTDATRIANLARPFRPLFLLQRYVLHARPPA